MIITSYTIKHKLTKYNKFFPSFQTLSTTNSGHMFFWSYLTRIKSGKKYVLKFSQDKLFTRNVPSSYGANLNTYKRNKNVIQWLNPKQRFTKLQNFPHKTTFKNFVYALNEISMDNVPLLFNGSISKQVKTILFTQM